MINFEELKSLVRHHAAAIGTRFSAYQQRSEQTACNALEYALSKAVAKRRDVWAGELYISAGDFLADVDYYYRYHPAVDTNYTDSYLVNIEDRRIRGSRTRSTTQYLRVEFC